MTIKSNEVYLWEEGNAMLGFCRVSVNGIEEEFGGGYSIVDRNGKITANGLAKNRAMKQVKIQFLNVIDALKLYGDKILDKEGNIDQQEFMKYEKSIQRTKAKKGKIDLNEKDIFTKLKDLKVNLIDSTKAYELGIGNN